MFPDHWCCLNSTHEAALMSNLYYSDKSLAARYDVSRATIWRWVREGNLPKPVKINGSTRWNSDDLATWEKREVVSQ